MREQIAAINPDAILIDGYDDAIIGLTKDWLAVYCYKKLVTITMRLCNTDSVVDAMEYVNFNIISAYVGENTPLIVFPLQS